MQVVLERIERATTQPIELLDLTAELRARCAASGIRHGLATLISQHTTAYLNLNEREAQLQRDMVTWLKRSVPRDGDWLHNLEPIDGRDNAHAHLLGLSMSASLSIPVHDGALLLGAWQSVFLVELDGPRERRQIVLHLLGER